MKLQDTPANCGPVSLANALEALHGRTCGITPEICEHLIGDTAIRGTNAQTMRRAAQRAGYIPHRVERLDSLLGQLALGRPAVVLVDLCEHWITVIGVLGERIITVDSADGGICRTYDIAEFSRRWADRKGLFFGYSLENKR